MANIPNMTDGDILNAAELFKLLGEDQTGGSSAGAEANIGEVQLTAGQASEGILIIASGKAIITGTFSTTDTIKLYTGENAAFGSNTLRKTITRTSSSSAGDTHDIEVGWSMSVFVSAETWANSIYVQITGAGDTVTCESLTVIGV